jgi:CDP-glucose 4,6-dehydratase
MASWAPRFYAGRTVLVTGHTGFKGTWLAHWLSMLGARVVGLALAPETRPSLFEASGLENRITSVLADVRELTAVRDVIDGHRPEIVFHLAAQSLVRRSYRDPVGTYATNVLGTAHVLEACRHAPSVRAIVVVTSDKCYDNREWPWGYREIEPMGGADPYSSSKGCAELVTAAYRRSFYGEGARVASGRAGNVIGGGDWAEDRLVPDIVRGVAADRPIAIRNPRSVRPWQHVLEPLSGYLTLARRLCEDGGGAVAQGYNFGPDDAEALSVAEVAERLVARLGRGRLAIAPDGGPHEAAHLRLDSSKARAELGWRPRLSLEETLAWTADWYRAHLGDPAAAAGLLDPQVQDYMRRG